MIEVVGANSARRPIWVCDDTLVLGELLVQGVRFTAPALQVEFVTE